MGMLDVFNSNAFGLVSLTKAINILPSVPSRIGQMKLFEDMPVATKTAVIEMLNGTISVFSTKPRGSRGQPAANDKRKVITVEVPHIPVDEEILAGDVQGVREFGTENEPASVDAYLNRRLERIKQGFELTWEWLRLGAITGKVLDADGSTLCDLFSAFGVQQHSVDFLLGTTTTEMATKAAEVKRWINDQMGLMAYDHVHAFCGQRFWDRFTTHTSVKYAYANSTSNVFLQRDPSESFKAFGIVWEEYSAKIGGKPVIPQDGAVFFPAGSPGLYGTYFAPADFEETVNTRGIPLYAKQEPLRLNRGRDLHVESNPLPVCHRPSALVAGTTSN